LSIVTEVEPAEIVADARVDWSERLPPFTIVRLSRNSHFPRTQVAAESHALPQLPQLESSLAVLTHEPLHAVGIAAGQLQTPPPHEPPMGQAFEVIAVEQPPQLAVSICKSWHLPSSAQNVVPVTQLTLQTPPLHTFPGGHALSLVPGVEHAPQFALSVLRSWHFASLQTCVPDVQFAAHVPALQSAPGGQASSEVPGVEHAPQLALSVVKSWHLPSLHKVVPATQVTPQCPALQT
jgi:hypothetical protein